MAAAAGGKAPASTAEGIASTLGSHTINLIVEKVPTVAACMLEEFKIASQMFGAASFEPTSQYLGQFFPHLAYPTNKGSGWADPAFYHVESAEKEDNCAPRGKHASAPHRPALPLPAIRLASASHTRSSFRPPLARSMHTSPNSARKRP